MTHARSRPRVVSAAPFLYDGDGGRVSKTTAAGTTTYVGKLWEVKPDGTTVKYVWAGATRLASKSSTGATLFYHPNHLGSTDLVTDAAGTQVAHYEYTPWGELFSTEGITVPHKFTGKELDPETGFYFYEARYYDPQLGRFITPDTIVPNFSDPQDFNRYSYAGNNPLKYTDPTGHFKFKNFFKKAAAIIIAAVVTVVTGGLGAPMAWALAAGGFAGGFGGTLINGGSIGQAIGMGIVGAFAGGVGGVAFQGLSGIARIAAMTAIGATAGASSAAIMGGNIGLGAAAGAAAGFIGGAVGGRLADSWAPGLARGAAALGTAAAAGAASSAVAGGNPGEGALLGATGVIAYAVASASFQAAVDVRRAIAGQEADRDVARAVVETKTLARFTTSRQQPGETTTSTASALTVSLAGAEQEATIGAARYLGMLYGQEIGAKLGAAIGGALGFRLGGIPGFYEGKMVGGAIGSAWGGSIGSSVTGEVVEAIYRLDGHADPVGHQ